MLHRVFLDNAVLRDVLVTRSGGSVINVVISSASAVAQMSGVCDASMAL